MCDYSHCPICTRQNAVAILGRCPGWQRWLTPMTQARGELRESATFSTVFITNVRLPIASLIIYAYS
jgi:hypothetical protein